MRDRDTIQSKFGRSFLTASIVLAALAGCGSTDSDGSGNGGSGNGGSGNGGGAGDGGVIEQNLVGAPGITITQVAIYQGPKRVLMEAGAPAAPGVPLVAGRPGWVRVFHQTDASYDGQPVIARLKVGGEVVAQAEVGPLGPLTVEEDVASGIGFEVAGEKIGAALDYEVGFYRAGAEGTGNPAATYTGSVAVEGKKNTFRLVIVPYQYNADGSGRLPNTSPEQLAVFKHRFMGMYPVSDVEISVHEPVPWDQPIGASGQGWQQVGFDLLGKKNNSGLGEDVYFYGMFNPAASLVAFCGGGCLLGVTLLNDDPPETGNPMLRLALGVGFDDRAADTCAHEIGHAHGRNHINCGPGVDPQSVDHAYPYPTNSIGGFAWDVTNKVLLDPSYTDIMGYCPKQWISDYNYSKLFLRTQNVNLEHVIAPPGGFAYDIAAFDGLGATRIERNVRFSRPIDGRRVNVEVRDRAGNERSLEATFVRYDHLDGGWLFLPAGEASEVSFVHADRRIDFD